MSAIHASADRLAAFPEIGRVGTSAGTREWVVYGLPYIIVYRIDVASDELVIIAVYRAAQRRG